MMHWLVAIAVAIAFAGGWKARDWKASADEKDRIAKLETERESDRLRKQVAAQQYEAWKADQRQKTVATTREVEHAVETDPWGAQRIPDEIRESLAGAAVATGSAERQTSGQQPAQADDRPSGDSKSWLPALHWPRSSQRP